MRRALLVVLLCTCTSTPPVSCPSGQSCSGACVNLAVDDANCGACGTACAATEACAGGACFPRDCAGRPCEPNQVCAAGSCTDKECVGVLCPAGLTCSNGACLCAAPRSTCGTACVDTHLDDSNCGVCGRVCGPDERCAQGECFQGACVDETCDPNSVCAQGRCEERACVGVLCPNGQTCLAGDCTCTGAVCGGVCVDTKLDDLNCGQCGTACDAGNSCAAGECWPDDCPGADCDPLSVCFRGSCVEAECVGVLCGGGKVCTLGRCVCPSGKTDCEGNCAALSMSADHCGRCDTACDAGFSCSGGTCAASNCPVAGQQRCGGACVDTTTDPQHCGQCGDACGTGRNCIGSACTCPQSLTLCGAACVNLANDPQHCGACGRTCNGGLCGTDGGCSCPGSMTLCNGSCRDTSNDPQFCGSCTRACPAGQVCSAGACACPAGFSMCNGSCLDTRSDNLHCGTCNRICNSGEACVDSNCVAPVLCQTNFNVAAAAGCAALPFGPGTCQAWSASGAQVFTNSLGNGASAVLALQPLAVDERLDLTATYSLDGGTIASVRVTVRNDAGAALSFDTTTVGPSMPQGLSHVWFGTRYGCAQPADVLMGNVAGNYGYTVTAARSTQPGFNRGGATLDASVPLATDGGRTCDLVCGGVRVCSVNEPQWYSFTLPARTAAAMQLRSATTPDTNASDIAAQLYDGTGAYKCDVFSEFINGGGASSDFTGRVVNNLNVPQTFYLLVRVYTTPGAQQFSLAVVQEQ